MRRSFQIVNKLGLHARAAAQLVKLAEQFSSEVKIGKDDQVVNGKSIMGLMMLAAGQGSKLRITAEGSDADKAVSEIEAIILRRFDEE